MYNPQFCRKSLFEDKADQASHFAKTSDQQKATLTDKKYFE